MKRSVSILVCTLFLLVTLSLPALASSGYDFQFEPNTDPPLYQSAGFVTDGSYVLRICANDDYLDLGVVDLQFEYDTLDSFYFADCSAEVEGLRFYFKFLASDEFDCSVLLISDEEDNYMNLPEGTSFLLLPVSSSLSDSVTSALDDVIGWVGVVLDSFMSGPLAPLFLILCVPIAVTALVFSIKAIKKNSWGI